MEEELRWGAGVDPETVSTYWLVPVLSKEAMEISFHPPLRYFGEKGFKF